MTGPVKMWKFLTLIFFPLFIQRCSRGVFLSVKKKNIGIDQKLMKLWYDELKGLLVLYRFVFDGCVLRKTHPKFFVLFFRRI
jgi:hypothetical protein